MQDTKKKKKEKQWRRNLPLGFSSSIAPIYRLPTVVSAEHLLGHAQSWDSGSELQLLGAARSAGSFAKVVILKVSSSRI